MAALNRPGDHRRKWDRDAYEKLASDRIQAEFEAIENAEDDETPVKRDLLKRREYRVDLDSKLGKSIVITKTTPQSQSGGYYCNVCDCVVKDSINFLDHINGKKHQQNLGMSMRIERSTLEQVKQRFDKNRKKMDEKVEEYDIEVRVQEMKDEEDRLKEYRRERKREKKRKANEAFEEDHQADPDMAALMGFTGFGSSKH